MDQIKKKFILSLILILNFQLFSLEYTEEEKIDINEEINKNNNFINFVNHLLFVANFSGLLTLQDAYNIKNNQNKIDKIYSLLMENFSKDELNNIFELTKKLSIEKAKDKVEFYAFKLALYCKLFFQNKRDEILNLRENQ